MSVNLPEDKCVLNVNRGIVARILNIKTGFVVNKRQTGRYMKLANKKYMFRDCSISPMGKNVTV